MAAEAGAAPVPPYLVKAALPLRVGAVTAADYDRAGRLGADLLESWVTSESEAGVKRLLDFGCGSGLVLRHLGPRWDATELWGSEPEPDGAAWTAEALSPRVVVLAQPQAPPLAAPDGHFDLIYAISAFTHIGEGWSAWLAELHRLLAPGGLVLAAFLGPGMIGPLLGERWSDDRIGIAFTRGNRPAPGGRATFVSEWWLRAHLGRAFDIVRLEPCGFRSGDPRGDYGAVLMRRRDVVVSEQELERPQADEPREWLSLRHNVRQLERALTLAESETVREREAADAANARADRIERHWRVAAEYWEDRADERQSLSWWIGAPLRRLRRRLRGPR